MKTNSALGEQFKPEQREGAGWLVRFAILSLVVGAAFVVAVAYLFVPFATSHNF